MKHLISIALIYWALTSSAGGVLLVGAFIVGLWALLKE
jgi:hypothetical protein